MNAFRINQEIRNDQDSGDGPLLSVVVPIFNERATISELLKQLLEERTDKEILLVDDGSEDESAGIVESWISSLEELEAHTHRIVWLRHDHNLRKGARTPAIPPDCISFPIVLR
ncbi:MAG: glycosyltransferase [Planctomycetes bacterium]|nr:glycosyltransferase [Planctomycetota bacterium]